MHHLVVQLSQMEHGGDMLLARGLSPKLSVKGAIVLTELAFPAHHSRQAQQRRNYDMGGIGTWQELSRRVPVIRWLNRGYKTVARRGASATTCGSPEGCETVSSRPGSVLRGRREAGCLGYNLRFAGGLRIGQLQTRVSFTRSSRGGVPRLQPAVCRRVAKQRNRWHQRRPGAGAKPLKLLTAHCSLLTAHCSLKKDGAATRT
jgi:hypothetical protein